MGEAGDWERLTISDGHFVDEIGAALREANIAFRVVEASAGQPMIMGPYTRFGRPDSKAIEVAAARLDDARALLTAMYAEASAAAESEVGLPPMTEAEREQERAWRAQVERKRARSAARAMWVVRLILAFIVLPLVYVLIRRTFFDG